MPPLIMTEDVDCGVDTGHRWQLVPKGGKRNLTVLDGAVADIQIANPAIARVTKLYRRDVMQFIQVEGLQPGTTTLTVNKGGLLAVPWTIHVASLIVLRISNHFVKGWRSEAKTTDAGLLLAFAAANRILEPQANVKLEAASWPAALVEVPSLRSKSITSRSGNHIGQGYWIGLKQSRAFEDMRDFGADVTAFYVERIDKFRLIGKPKTDVGGFSVGRKRTVFVEDDKSLDTLGRNLAHEVCHAFGVEHVDDKVPENEAATRLMAKACGPANTKLVKDEILTLRELDSHLP